MKLARYKKGSRVIYNGENYTVWRQENYMLRIYKPEAEMPELTFVATHVNNVKKEVAR